MVRHGSFLPGLLPGWLASDTTRTDELLEGRQSLLLQTVICNGYEKSWFGFFFPPTWVFSLGYDANAKAYANAS